MGKKKKRYFGKRKIAVFNSKNEFIRYCTIAEANEKCSKGRGVFIDTRVMKLFPDNSNMRMEKQQVRIKDNRTCYICGDKISNSQCTVDHVIPISRTTDAWTRDNMRCCCKRCNEDKGHMTLKEYIKHIENNRSDYLYISTNKLSELKSYADKQEKSFKERRDVN